uniref:Zinc finger, CCHC-type n=1 Tax=Tanacetum cinerariifolium TaxID=118510 RepID=A0A6L2NTU5_TANCI|nr:hypothetical protein [Tanacetum cinerariifolium]
MKDMGEADVILGIKIKRENRGIVITQSYYIEKILKKFNRENYSSVSTPMNPVEKLKSNTGKPVDQLEYSRAIGCLMYVMTSTRPDITYVVGRLSRFTSNPRRQHLKEKTKVFKYLRGTKDYGLSYVGYPLVLEGIQIMAIRNLIYEIPIWLKPKVPISIRCDSAPTMAKAFSQVYNGKSRHLGVRHSVIKTLIMKSTKYLILLEYITTASSRNDPCSLVVFGGVHEQIRRIFLDGYGVLDVRTALILHSSLLCDCVITFSSIGIKSHGVDCLDLCLVDFRACVLRLLVKFVGFAFLENFVLNRSINMASLADKAILSGVDNHPPMLKKDMYDSWKSRMELYMLNRQHGRMILSSVEQGSLIWPSVEVDGVTRLKKYSKLSAAEAIQADCDVKATNIILQGLPPEVYALVSTHKVAKELWERN